jgi:phosphatidylserine/phosphatidylglycerophosphate/cardiolipin synthase-like enzyme
VKLLVQPGDGISPLVRGIASAKSCVEIVIFRFDQREIERALANAVSRGVAVHALIAHTNRAGEQALRELEMRLLGAGVTVARTADDLARYHYKMMIVDRRELFVLAFNLTHVDIERSRSFALITRSRDLVREAEKLFEADTKRLPYEPDSSRFIVSPLNARKELATFIKGARKELVIYDPKISDPTMLRLLGERAAAGVNIRVIGRVTRKIPGVKVHKPSGMRLHTRTMVRDRNFGFIGSQSLRELELDERREVGVIFRDTRIVSRLQKVFEEDWEVCERCDVAAPADESVTTVKIAKKVAKALTKELPPVAPLVDGAVRELVGDGREVDFDPKEMEEIVKRTVKEAVKEAVRDVVEEAVVAR